MTKWFALSTLCFSCQLAFAEVDIETIIPDLLITDTYQDIPVTLTGLDVGKRYIVEYGIKDIDESASYEDSLQAFPSQEPEHLLKVAIIDSSGDVEALAPSIQIPSDIENGQYAFIVRYKQIPSLVEETKPQKVSEEPDWINWHSSQPVEVLTVDRPDILITDFNVLQGSLLDIKETDYIDINEEVFLPVDVEINYRVDAHPVEKEFSIGFYLDINGVVFPLSILNSSMGENSRDIDPVYEVYNECKSDHEEVFDLLNNDENTTVCKYASPGTKYSVAGVLLLNENVIRNLSVIENFSSVSFLSIIDPDFRVDELKGNKFNNTKEFSITVAN